jgi:RNA polymerase sigma-70 factor (ECF subfamily)
MDDLVLARRVLAGDDSAAEELFEEYFPRLYRFARLRLGGADDAAEEVVQAALIRAVRKLHTYRGEAALFSWLCTLCRQEIGLWRRRAGRVDELELAEDRLDVRQALEAAARMGADDPERLAARHELAELVHETLDQLPARYGQALEWKYLQGQSTGEIAGRLGIGYKAAESLLTRAREAFRDGFAVVLSEAS